MREIPFGGNIFLNESTHFKTRGGESISEGKKKIPHKLLIRDRHKYRTTVLFRMRLYKRC